MTIWQEALSKDAWKYGFPGTKKKHLLRSPWLGGRQFTGSRKQFPSTE